MRGFCAASGHRSWAPGFVFTQEYDTNVPSNRKSALMRDTMEYIKVNVINPMTNKIKKHTQNYNLRMFKLPYQLAYIILFNIIFSYCKVKWGKTS